MQLEPTKSNYLAFYEALQRGKDALVEAGRILVAILEEDPNAKERILEDNPEVTSDLLDTFERIGRGQLYHKLCLLETPGVRALRRCAYSDQVKYSEAPIPMLLLQARDETDHLQVSVYALNSEQTRQVFGRNRVRTLAEQRAYLEACRAKPQPLARREPYTLAKGRVTFHEPVTLTASDLARLLAEITS